MHGWRLHIIVYVRLLQQLAHDPISNRTTTNEDFDEVHKVVLDGISDNTSAISQNGKDGAINTADPTTMGYYFSNYYQNHICYKTKKQLTKNS